MTHPDAMSYLYSKRIQDLDTLSVKASPPKFGIKDLIYQKKWYEKDPFILLLQWIIALLIWILPTLKFEELDFNLEREDMSYLNPEAATVRRADTEDEDKDKTRSLEEEILRMEKYRKELIKKMGGERYEKVMDGLIKKKQNRYRS